MGFASDIIHSGHIKIIEKASALGEVTIGVFTDEVIASYDRYPLVPLESRIKIFQGLKGVTNVVIQDELYYDKNLREGKYDYVVHGDDWKDNILAKVRKRVIEVLAEWGGELVEFPYSYSDSIDALEAGLLERTGMPEVRRPRLRWLLKNKGLISVMEAHSGLSGLIVEKTRVEDENGWKQFDAMWVSSLCDSTIKGKPDIELVDMTSRIKTIDEIMEVTTKPIIFDGDTGGQIEHFVYNIQTLERIGISAIIIEDKVGLKKNSLFGTEVKQEQDSIEHFCQKIKAGKKALKTNDFMIIARIESLILQNGMEDALNRAEAYVEAGADGIMIHSKMKEPDEILEFCEKFRQKYEEIPLVIVPTTFNTVTESEWKEHGVNVVIHANHLIRSAYPAMKKTAETILKTGRSYEVDELCMPIKEILTLIPGGK